MGDFSVKTDVAVIGSGIMGCASAYYLAKEGLHVIVLEKKCCRWFGGFRSLRRRCAPTGFVGFGRWRHLLQPRLGNESFLRAFSEITKYTPDRQPYIVALPDVSGFYAASGFSG
jgi:glycine/D-amino acid oxidase-like deaminating enzyme